jgi:hypothetical protein
MTLKLLQVFETVVPSERMRVSVHIRDSAFRFVGKEKPVSGLILIDGISLSTDLGDQLSDSELQVKLSRLDMMLSEDYLLNRGLQVNQDDPSPGINRWKVRQAVLYTDQH